MTKNTDTQIHKYTNTKIRKGKHTQIQTGITLIHINPAVLCSNGSHQWSGEQKTVLTFFDQAHICAISKMFFLVLFQAFACLVIIAIYQCVPPCYNYKYLCHLKCVRALFSGDHYN